MTEPLTPAEHVEWCACRSVSDHDDCAPRPWTEQDGDTRCQRCGHVNPPWWAPNELWNRVLGTPDNPRAEGIVLCASCFLADVQATLPQGTTVTEWGVRWSPEHEVERMMTDYHGFITREWPESEAMRMHRQPTTARAYTRQRTTFPDRVTDWTEVSDD